MAPESTHPIKRAWDDQITRWAHLTDQWALTAETRRAQEQSFTEARDQLADRDSAELAAQHDALSDALREELDRFDPTDAVVFDTAPDTANAYSLSAEAAKLEYHAASLRVLAAGLRLRAAIDDQLDRRDAE